MIFEPVFQRSDFFPVTKWVHEAASVFCVEMMHSLIHGTYLNPLFPCGRYKLQSMLEIKHLFFCTFQPVKITGKFYRQATAQCSHQETLRWFSLLNQQPGLWYFFQHFVLQGWCSYVAGEYLILKIPQSLPLRFLPAAATHGLHAGSLD